MSSFKRDFADKLDVDVYSSNKVLQKELNSVAWAATVGDWAFSVAMLPAGAAGSAVSNIRLANSFKNALKCEPPARLRIINNEKLEKIGIPEDLRKRFLDHPVFTPRHDTIIAANLEQMGGVAGRDAFLNLALRAEDEAHANFYMNMDLTESEAKGFWPVYEAYQQDLQTLNKRLSKLIASYAEDYRNKTLTDAKAKTLIDEAVAIEKAEAELWSVYVPKLSSVLPAKKVARYLQIESKIRAVVKYELKAEVPLCHENVRVGLRRGTVRVSRGPDNR